MMVSILMLTSGLKASTSLSSEGMPLNVAEAHEQKYNIYVVNHTWLLDTVSQNDIKNPLNEHFSFTRLGRDIEY